MSGKFVLRSIGFVAVCLFTLSACGGQEAPPAPPAGGGEAQAVLASPPAEDVQCGTVPSADGTQAKVIIREGAVECAEAVTLLTQYFARVTPAAAASPDGAGPIAIEPWTCGSEPGSVVTATCSTEDGREVAAEPAR
ncbi:hypothetical protein [Amycolatopsis dongchuanensis]|uniref:Secreted protein n=1 Tax=Amycolatopsis dongchuanensis TaxID=1070866 RepID=A0ABP9Q584_9PSEU